MKLACWLLKLDIIFTAFKYLQSENALIFDGVRMFAKAMDDLTAIEGISFPPINCNNYPSSRNWTGGDKLMLYLKVIYAGTVCTKYVHTKVYWPITSFPTELS